jgi:hypothetical protein
MKQRRDCHDTGWNRRIVRGRLNFAADRENGGVFSNFDPSLNKQSLEGRDVTIRDARSLPSPPKLGCRRLRTPSPALSRCGFPQSRVGREGHGPQVEDYVKTATGAAATVPFGGYRALIRDTGKFVPGLSIAADSFTWTTHPSRG